MKRRAVVLFPGRGSYGSRDRGSLRRHDADARVAALARAHAAEIDAMRGRLNLPPIAELDAAELKPTVHLRAENATPLIVLASLLDFERVRGRFEIVGVGGNSLGWTTSLVASGALEPADGFRLAQETALAQSRLAPGGQLVMPVVDAAWHRDARAEREVDDALAAASAGNGAFAAGLSIRLGGYRVLAGTDAALEELERALPRRQLGERTYPQRLPMHGAYHTPLVEPVAREVQARFADLPVRRPDVPLIDGRGLIHSPWSADPSELRAYTLGPQLVETFDFTAVVRAALRELGPDVCLLAGPGTTLAGTVGQVLVEEGWRGAASRADVEAAREDPDRLLLALGHPPDFSRAIAG